ncbi:hypothetical protein ZIOFF_067336 [Zingiber officinale]|uniref:Uncharacterized protein n=1 Tax=Zingiber officinale TaxID=94328 RepID=A0A8J5ESQ1_ZINOF|nr:hypothetical protein ZIOFF_067336 [Zingiber officinale]
MTPPRLSALAVAARLPSISPYHRTTARVSKPFDSHSTLYIKPKAQSKGRIQWLAHGPRKHVTSYTGYIVNGYRFHTIDVGRSLHSFQRMSKMVKKRGKGSVAEIQENITNKLSRMDSNNSANSSEDLHGKEPITDEKIDKKKGRGASKLKMVSGQDKCKELERNEFGQPIGDNSVKYASFLGCMIKEFVPYTLDGWSDIDEEVKDRMWSCLQMTYKVEDWEKKTIFQKLAKLWHDRKSKLQILVREANTSRVASRDLSLLKPEFMDQNQWDLFVQRTLSSTFQKKLLECPPESQNTTNIADDAISIVFGNEARGRVRGMGFGVTPSKVGASVQQNGMVQQLQTIVQNVQQQMQEMRQQNQLEMQEMSGIGNEFGSNSDINIGAKKSGDFGHVFQSNSRNASRGDICANTKCKLLHWSADELVVAEG